MMENAFIITKLISSMAWVTRIIMMAASMKASGRMAKCTVKACILILTETSIKAISTEGKSGVKVD